MPTFSYRALSQLGEIVSGSIAAPTAAEVGRRIEYLGLIPIDSIAQETDALIKRGDGFALFSRPRPEDVTPRDARFIAVYIARKIHLIMADGPIMPQMTGDGVTSARLPGAL